MARTTLIKDNKSHDIVKTSEIFTNFKNNNIYTRIYLKDGAFFRVTSGYRTNHDFLIVRVDYPKSVIDSLKMSKLFTDAGCTLPVDVEKKLKSLFLNMSFPIEDDEVLASIIKLTIPEGYTLKECPEIEIIWGKEYLEENEVGYEYPTWDRYAEINYKYGKNVKTNLTDLINPIDNVESVDAVITGDEAKLPKM